MPAIEDDRGKSALFRLGLHRLSQRFAAFGRHRCLLRRPREMAEESGDGCGRLLDGRSTDASHPRHSLTPRNDTGCFF